MKGKERLRIQNKNGCNFLDYLYTPKRALELDTWGNFIENFKTLPKNVQELVIKKLHGGTKVWCIQLKILIINTTQLMKYRRWLLVMVCLLTLIPITKVAATYHIIKLHDRRKFTKPNINVLVEKWIPCDLLWILRLLRFKYAMRLRGNEE
jgi:hypothetical protein